MMKIIFTQAFIFITPDHIYFSDILNNPRVMSRKNYQDQSFQVQDKKPKKVKNPVTNEKIYYDCQCGKRYDAFPGLYLHFKRKHQIKISINPDSNQYHVRTTPFSKVFTYFFKKQTSHLNDTVKIDENFYSKLKVILEEYYKTGNFETTKKSISLMTLDKLCLFLSSKAQQQRGVSEGQFMEKLPMKFNDFFLNEVKDKTINSQNIQDWKFTLITFSKWLKSKGYTEMIVLDNQSFVMEQID